MIPEQALFNLPEILTGSGFPDQHYEGGVVGAYSLALLQALNGRNVPNPIACLQTERPFRGTEGWPTNDPNEFRYLRGDLYVNLDELKIASERLSAYGWRFHNWIEAKFFRRTTTNKQQNTGSLLADLLRIIALVPSERGKGKEITGRFLLHVYESFTIGQYVTIKKQTGGGSEPRKWLKPLITHGHHTCPRLKLSEYEVEGMLGEINANLGDIEIEFEATSFRIEPVQDLGAQRKQYVCILSRIDSFTLWRGATSFTVGSDRMVSEIPNAQAVRANIQEHIAKWISIKGASETQQPEAPEVEDAAALEVEPPPAQL